MTVAPATLVALIIGTLIVALLPIVVFRLLKSPMKVDRRDAIVGIAAFMLFATLIERGVYALVLHLPGAAATLSQPGLFAAFGLIAPAVIEEAGRYLGLRFVERRYGASLGDGRGFGYGVGFGGAQAWYVGVVVLGQWVWLVWLAQRGQLNAQLSTMPPDLALRIQMMLVTMSASTVGVRVLECIAMFTFQVAMSVLVWRGVRARKAWILPLAIVLHPLADLPLIAFNAGALSISTMVTAYGLLTMVLVAALARWSRPAPRTA
ncbi:YhfC family glutamic-type intramembrane protease [Burkholderia sp. Ac-20379]|uniref:YhfC family glutamic-type intramembrane protease n=1 Tax=Burkholderia sp. Ac-20379 TaxID=2703900 RepID=UPI00197E8A85|nr:YhfC family glutamic-type intramembrane protease [Burkholderia sp. Ac-20379]MBN3726349.1 YhfC family intramembrane metalloprotease [Burkholderia sp. Ac-20379]